MDFEWDETMREILLRDRGIDFLLLAHSIFDGRPVMTIPSPRLAEDVLPEGWEQAAIMGLPPRKEPINLRIDADIFDWFRQSGKGYQTRINNVLRAFVESRRG